MTAPGELCDALKQSLLAFRSKGLTKQKDLRKAYGALCRSLGVEHAAVAQPANRPAQEPKKEDGTKETAPVDTVAETKGETKDPKVNGLKKKVKRGKHAGQLEKKEAKKRRMEAAAEGFAGVSFPTANVDIDVRDDADGANDAVPVVPDAPRPKKTPKKKALGEANRANEADLVKSTPAKQKKQPGNSGATRYLVAINRSPSRLSNRRSRHAQDAEDAEETESRDDAPVDATVDALVRQEGEEDAGEDAGEDAQEEPE